MSIYIIYNYLCIIFLGLSRQNPGKSYFQQQLLTLAMTYEAGGVQPWSSGNRANGSGGGEGRRRRVLWMFASKK